MSIESLILDLGMNLEPKIDRVPRFGVYVVDTDSHIYVMDDFGSLVSLTNETFAFASNAFYRFS